MKPLVLVLGISVLVSGTPCFAEHPRFPASIELGTRFGRFHGCAVEGVILTSAHAIDMRRPWDIFVPREACARYSTVYGEEGLACSVAIIKGADIAILAPRKRLRYYGEASLSAPQLGDTGWWVEYDRRDQGKAYQRRQRQGEVTKLTAGAVILKEDSTSGASGGCAFDESGRVFGLLTWGSELEDRSEVTGVVGIWGVWLEDLRRAIRAASKGGE